MATTGVRRWNQADKGEDMSHPRSLAVMLAAAVLVLLAPAPGAWATHDPRYFVGQGPTSEQAIAGAQAAKETYEREQGVDCVERSTYVAWDPEREIWEATITADCPPDDRELRYFSGQGPSKRQAVVAARAAMSAYEQQHDVDCRTRSRYPAWDPEHERWEATITAGCEVVPEGAASALPGGALRPLVTRRLAFPS